MATTASGALPGAQLPRARISFPVLQAQNAPLQLPLPLQQANTGAPSSRRLANQPPASRLTWSFAFCALFAMGSFFIAHVLLSSWLISEETLLERSRWSSFRKHQLLHFQKNSDLASSTEAGGMKRILVLGCHHTGTSVVTKLIIESGAYPGSDLVMLPGNDLKYNEYRPAVEANKRVMAKGHPELHHGPFWVDYGYSWSQVPLEEKNTFIQSVDKIIHDLDQETAAKQKRAWVLKDPRMSILAEHWVSRSPNSICVLVTRNPIEASIRLAVKYNRGSGQALNVNEWMEFWAQSMITAARTCVRLKRRIVFASHEELASDPFAFARKLEKDLFGENRRFTEPKDVFSILGESFTSKALVNEEESAQHPINQLLWTPNVLKTWTALSTQNLAGLPLPSPMKPIIREAYATIVTGNGKGFIAGAIALAQSIRNFDKTRDLIAMLSVEVTEPSVKNALTLAGWRTVEVKKLEEPWYEMHPKCRSFSESQKVRWGRMFSKLRVYSLPYQHVLYLDTDTMLLRDVDALFSLPGDFYAERSPSHKGFNAGIMLLRPSTQVLEQLISYARNNEPMQFWAKNQVGCTEQELLNRYYNGSNLERKLNNTRHFDYLSKPFVEDAGREEIRDFGARVAHCLTTKCPKPWDIELDKLFRHSRKFKIDAVPMHCDRLMYLEWYRLFLSPEMKDAINSLTEGGNEDVKALADPLPYSFGEVEKEINSLAGPARINFRRDWRGVDFDRRFESRPGQNLKPLKQKLFN